MALSGLEKNRMASCKVLGFMGVASMCVISHTDADLSSILLPSSDRCDPRLHRTTLRLAEIGGAIWESDLRFLQRGGQPKTEDLPVIPLRRPQHQDGALSPQVARNLVVVPRA